MELVLFYIAAFIAIVSTILAITRLNASHALVYLIVSLLAVAAIFFLLGAPFAAALEIIVYAGAIVVLFLFVVMMLNLGRSSVNREREWVMPGMWVLPGLFAGVLFVVVGLAIYDQDVVTNVERAVGPKEVGTLLFGRYVLAVELAGVLLLAALVGAYHLGRHYLIERREEE